MLADYLRLKAATGLRSDDLLGLFERYCRRAADAMDTMEWSWKFAGWEAAGNRVFWLGSGRHRDLTRRSLAWLTAELGLPRSEADRDWLELIDHGIDRALVAYAGPNRATGRPAVIKIYLTLGRCTPSTYRHLVRAAASSLPRDPPGAGVVLLCRTIEAGRPGSSRVYTLFNDREVRHPRVARFLERLIGARGLAAAANYPRIGVGLKTDGTNMLGIGLRPTGRRRLDPAYLMTPVMVPLVHAAVRTPLLSERLEDVTWVTVPLDKRSLTFPRRLPEMNVYVRLRH